LATPTENAMSHPPRVRKYVRESLPIIALPD
jgi:hypothetical protein